MHRKRLVFVNNLKLLPLKGTANVRHIDFEYALSCSIPELTISGQIKRSILDHSTDRLSFRRKLRALDKQNSTVVRSSMQYNFNYPWPEVWSLFYRRLLNVIGIVLTVNPGQKIAFGK